MKSMMVAAVIAAMLGFGAEARAQEVRVTLTGVEARGGQLLASLQTEDQFMQPRGTYGVQQVAPTTNGSVTLVFSNVGPGTYSLSVMHDANGDEQMQRDANGRPLEGWAMSHEATFHAPPTFAQASFAVTADAPTVLTEAMNYPAAH